MILGYIFNRTGLRSHALERGKDELVLSETTMDGRSLRGKPMDFKAPLGIIYFRSVILNLESVAGDMVPK